MARFDDVFEVEVANYGSGWNGLSVGVVRGHRPESLSDKKGVCSLKVEASTSEQFDRDIDELVAKLKELKSNGRRKLASLAND
jgi:hypothetical protein